MGLVLVSESLVLSVALRVTDRHYVPFGRWRTLPFPSIWNSYVKGNIWNRLAILVKVCFSGIKTLVVGFTVEDPTSSVHDTLAWKFRLILFSIITRYKLLMLLELVAQWIRRLTSNQKIAGSNSGEVETFRESLASQGARFRQLLSCGMCRRN